MTPRQVVFALPSNKTVGEALDENGNWPYSRIPLYGENKETWVGVILRQGISIITWQTAIVMFP